MRTFAKEDYLKYLLELQENQLSEKISIGKLAREVGVTPGTCTTMVKGLHKDGLISHQPYQGVRLTVDGEIEAAKILRRHRIVELFLVKCMGMAWEDVHEDAEKLEHAISDRVLARMDEMLDYPTEDPHGDPIPDKNGKYDKGPKPVRLIDCQPAKSYKISRVVDENPEFLRFLEKMELRPGSIINSFELDNAGDLVKIKTYSQEYISIGISAAAKLLVLPVGK
jgi:DtxR family Mn-dependent transcriptional regulator